MDLSNPLMCQPHSLPQYKLMLLYLFAYAGLCAAFFLNPQQYWWDEPSAVFPLLLWVSVYLPCEVSDRDDEWGRSVMGWDLSLSQPLHTAMSPPSGLIWCCAFRIVTQCLYTPPPPHTSFTSTPRPRPAPPLYTIVENWINLPWANCNLIIVSQLIEWPFSRYLLYVL